MKYDFLDKFFHLTYIVPPIPSRLYIVDPNDIKKLGSDWEGDNPVYSTYRVSDELQTWVQSFFKLPIIVNYQIINGQIPIHKDIGRTKCWNYLIDVGGPNVATQWWNDDETEVIRSVVFRGHCWYSLNVGIKHNVTNVEGNRIAITVWQDPVDGSIEL